MEKSFHTRLASGLLAILMGFSCLSSTAIPAFAEPVTSVAATQQVDSTSTPETSDPSKVNDFLAAVEKIDYEEVVKRAKAYGELKSKSDADANNEGLAKQVEDASASLDEVAQVVYDAVDLYNGLEEKEQQQEAVVNAYSVLARAHTDLIYYMSNPEKEQADNKDALEEALGNLYDELPDKPTGYYIGSRGLPVATGDTKISLNEWDLSAWDQSYMDANGNGRLDGSHLNEDASSMTIGKAEGNEFAIVPVMAQVEYPANNSKLTISVPNGVEVLSFNSASDNIQVASGDELDEIIQKTFSEVSAEAFGMYLKADKDFILTATYTDDEGNKIVKELKVIIGENVESERVFPETDIVTYAAGVPEPASKTGRITKIEKVNGTWLIWFNGEEAYCCDHGLYAAPNGSPQYSYTYTSKLGPGQYTGDHYTTQVSVWGGLNQMSLESLPEKHEVATFDASEFAQGVENSIATYAAVDENVLRTAYQYYDDAQLWIIKNYPNSDVAKIYMQQAKELMNADKDISTYYVDVDKGYYTFIFEPPIDGWQRVALLGPAIGQSGEVEIPDVPDVPKPTYYANKSGSFTFTYDVLATKIQRNTYEKVDGAVLGLKPVTTSGIIDDGTWTIAPSETVSITTGGHTNDDNYQNNGGAATASWTLSYSVSKSAGPCDSQEEADNQAQQKVDAAIAAAKEQLTNIQFKYDEIAAPYGFEEDAGEKGSHQDIIVAQGGQQEFVMNDDEWAVKVNLDKIDSETGNRIAADSTFEVYEWDTVTQQYIPFGGYNMYSVDRNADGTYSVRNHSAYADTDEKSYTMYYTQRNEGKFVIVESKAPQGYFGDWTDPQNPGVVNTPLGKRAYYIEITKENDGSVINLDNKDYSADIATSDNGGTKLLTSGGVITTVTISKASEEPAAAVTYKDPARCYDTDNSKTAANEDEYHTANDKDGLFQNDRVLGEISLSKVDLDAVRYVDGRTAKDNAMVSGESHGDAVLDSAIYDLYAAEDIQHPDGVSGIVDYSKITYEDGTPVWHTTIRENSGHWNQDYLPVLAKDHLVASAKIENGWLTFSNLYLGRYYIVERGTSVVIPVEATTNIYFNDGTYPEVDEKTKEATGNRLPLASEDNIYTDYIYKNQYSVVESGKNQDSRKTYDGLYLSYSKGYLCDEHNYYMAPAYTSEGSYVEKITFEDNRQSEGEGRDTTAYSKYYNIQKSNDLTESQEQVMKTDIELSKRVSSTGESNGDPIEGAGFTLYLISDLSKADQIATSRSGKYLLNSLWDLYVNPNYDQDHPKWDFSGETQAIAKTYEVDASEVAAYNESLTEAGDFANGKGEGWVATGNPNEYQLSEIFSNDTGDIRVCGLPYGQYLLIETTVPADHFQADPVIIDVDPDTGVVSESRLSDPKGAVTAPSGSYMKYTILNELVEAYLRIVKIDDETGKPVLREGTAFQLYWIDDNGNYILDKNGNPRLVTMTATADGSAVKKVDTFYSTADGIIVLPEKLEVGRYRIVEVNGPEGFYNKWMDTAQYGENGILLDKGENGTYATGDFYVDFSVTTNRIYEATGDLNEDDQDNLLIEEKYHNNETLGKLTIRKNGAVLTGFKDGKFTYETRPLAGAEFQIIAAEDIYTQDNQKDANGERTVWYKAGDVVATVTSGDSTADTVVFAPARTKATYDFLSVIHDGTIGEVGVTLPLGKYTVVESKAPYGYVLNDTKYDVEFTWDNQIQDVNFATGINRTLQVKADVLPTTSTVTLMVNGQPQEFLMGDVNMDGQITEEDAQLVRDYVAEQAYMQVLAKEALEKFMQFLKDHPGEVPPPMDSYEPQHALSVNQTYLANVSDNTVSNPRDGVSYADAEIISAFAKGKIERMPYTMDHPETQTLETTDTFDNTRVKDASEEFADSQILRFVNDREQARVGVFKFDSKTNKFVSGAVFELYTDDDIYNADGEKIFSAGDLVATSPETSANGYTYFDVDVPVRGENYKNYEYTGLDSTTNSGNYTVKEIKTPEGYFLDKDEMHVSFTYDGQALEVLDSECKNTPSTIYVSKRQLTGDEELPGATLNIKDKAGNVIREWVSTNEKMEINALAFSDGNEYTLTETRPADGYALASDITFRLAQRVDADGNEVDAVDVFYKDTDENGHVTWTKLDDETVIMRDDVTKVKISKKDIANNEELPGADLTIKDKDGNVVDSWTSTNEPHYIEKLPAGDYTLSEVTAPNGYKKAEDVKFTVQPIGEIQVVTMYDRPDDQEHEYGIQIYKVDAVTKQPLEGVEFRILDADKKVVKVGKTNEAGNLWFGLDKGNYFYQESKVPSGYLCDDTLRAFSITSENQVVEIQFENQRSPLNGVINFLTGTTPNRKTGTLPNGTAVEEVMAISQNTGAEVVTATPKAPVTLIVGLLLIVCSMAGAGYYFLRKRKS